MNTDQLRQLLTRPVGERPLFVVNWGMGVDSTALLCGLYDLGLRPDVILAADTGSEKPETYAYVPYFARWCASVGFPIPTVVKNKPKKFKHAAYDSLHGNCIVNATLPGIAFGGGSCAMKWKAEPMHRWLAARADVRACWARGERVIRAIGYDASAADQRRIKHATQLQAKRQASGKLNRDDKCYDFIYLLAEWGWDRARCLREIEQHGLRPPMKSACFMCSASHLSEIEWLTEEHPELADLILEMERRAQPNLQWRDTVTGATRVSVQLGASSFVVERPASVEATYAPSGRAAGLYVSVRIVEAGGEVRKLVAKKQELRIVVEGGATKSVQLVEGLWRRATKRSRSGGPGHPGDMTTTIMARRSSGLRVLREQLPDCGACGAG